MRPARAAATIAVPSAEADRRTKENDRRRGHPPRRPPTPVSSTTSSPARVAMCRWMAWFGQPVLIEDVLFKTPHGIVDQSLHSRMGAETTNGEGFGIGWYGAGEGPGVYHSVE